MVRFQEQAKKLNILLDLNRKIVGVKLLKDKDEYDSYKVTSLVNPLPYCLAVKSATLGHRIKFNKENSGCGGSTTALGFAKPTDDFLDGSSPFSWGLFSSKNVAQRAALETDNILTNTYGVLVQPLELYDEDDLPDVVIIVGKPRELMRVIQGYSFFHGIGKTFSMSGNQGVCVETTAYPLIHNTINVSLLCSGTRYLAHWGEDEGTVGFPLNLLNDVVEGLAGTVNSVEMDARKKEISDGLKAHSLQSLEIDYGKTYYTEYEEEKRAKREEEQKKNASKA